MNLPNTLTLSRFFLIPAYMYVFYLGYIKTSFIILLLAGLTDIIDGRMARSRGQVTQVGVMLDPLADKLMMITVIISFVLSGRVPWTAAAAIFFRDIGMIVCSAFFHFRGKKTVPANIMGKLTTVLFYIAILLVIFEIPLAIPYLWFVIIVSYITSILYAFQFVTINQGEESKLS